MPDEAMILHWQETAPGSEVWVAEAGTLRATVQRAEYDPTRWDFTTEVQGAPNHCYTGSTAIGPEMPKRICENYAREKRKRLARELARAQDGSLLAECRAWGLLAAEA